MNKLMVSGHLTQDPILKTGKSGLSYTTLNVVNKDNKVPVNLAIMVFGKDAEISCKYLTEARSLEIEAKIETDQRTKGLMYVSEKIIFGDKPAASNKPEAEPDTEPELIKASSITDEDF
jgi:single-stranded DNA-binding protein